MMKVSYRWLKELIEIDLTPQILAEKLTMAGLEVEDIITFEPEFKKVVIGKITSIERHPYADRLSLCKVETDTGSHSIVCGATNMKVLDRVALALPGAMLPGGRKIKRTSIRGVESEGMMCSPKELGLGEEDDILLILPPDSKIGEDFAEAFGLTDTILDLGITPNRPDCLSMIGVAREVSAITGIAFKEPMVSVEKDRGLIDNWITVDIKEPVLCPRYTTKVLDGVTIDSSPFWLKHRLESMGIRSINNVVDITNLVMLERGQPLHAFDYNAIDGKMLAIRRAKQGEEIITLDGVKRSLTDEMLVIADRARALAIAGVMGGLESEVKKETTTILLESAYFQPQSVRRTAKKLNLCTESSYRFERGVDPACNIVAAIERTASLIKTYANGKATTTLDVLKTPIPVSSIAFRPERAKNILGIDIGKDEMLSILKRLGVKTKDGRQGFLTAEPPSFRIDLKEEIDLVEEIARLKGYDKVPETLPRINLSLVKLEKDQSFERKVRSVLRDYGFLEVMNYSFVSQALLKNFGFKEDTLINILNPLTEEQSVMRPSLLPGLLDNLKLNLNYKNNNIRIFELNKVFFHQNDKSIKEKRRLSGLCSGLRWHGLWGMGKERVDIYDIKGVLEALLTLLYINGIDFQPLLDIPYMHPKRSYSIIINKQDLGIMGEVHPDLLYEMDISQPVLIFDIDFEGLAHLKAARKLFSPLPKYPSIVRDISFIIDDSISYRDIKELVERVNTFNIESVGVFDIYKGKGISEGKKSMALRVTYRSPKKTLTEEEINKIHNKVIKKLKEEYGAIIR